MSKKHERHERHERLRMQALNIAKILLVIFSFLLVIFSVLPVRANDYSSTNFILRDPVITIAGGQSSSSNFQYFSTVGELSPGESSSSNFTYRAGFLYFPVASSTRTPETIIINTFDSTAGGSTTLTNTNNSQVIFNFPTNFYIEDLTLQASSYANNSFLSDKPAVSGKDFVGKTYDFNLLTTSGDAVNAVSKPVTIELDYTDSDVSGIDESTIRPYRWGSSDSSWQLIAGSSVDTVNNRVIFDTTHFSSFALFGSPIQQQPGGRTSTGGGGGSITGVYFLGRAYPLSKITVLKDGQIAVTTIAGPDANFNVSLSGLSTGNYTFSVYGQDNKGLRSTLFNFPIFITQGATATIGGIFITPTIDVDKDEVKRGDNIAIFGQSAPNAEVTIAINSDQEFFGKIKSQKDGSYLYNFDTSSLENGQHLTKSKAALDNSVSSFGRAIVFTVGTKNIFSQPEKVSYRGDLNNDKRVSIIDFSIAAYWYKRPSPPSSVDFNSDGKIDLIDFSIMAANWTG